MAVQPLADPSLRDTHEIRERGLRQSGFLEIGGKLHGYYISTADHEQQ